MTVATIKSEQLFPAGIYDIVGNSSIGYLNQGTLTEALSVLPIGPGGLNPPQGNIVQVPSNLIMTDQVIQFKFEWGVYGSFAHAFNPIFEWRIQLYFELWGGGEYTIGPIGSVVVPMGSGNVPNPMQVDFPGTVPATITIPANTIPVGLYDVVAVIQLHDMPSGLPCFSAAFAEFNKINFYREHH